MVRRLRLVRLAAAVAQCWQVVCCFDPVQLLRLVLGCIHVRICHLVSPVRLFKVTCTWSRGHHVVC